MTHTTEKNIAEEMLRILPHNRTWSSGNLKVGPRRCLLGARLHANGVVNMNVTTNLEWLNRDPYVLLLARIIAEQFPERLYRDPSGQTRTTPVRNVISFNDSPDTHFPDIHMLLEKAAALWDEREGHDDIPDG